MITPIEAPAAHNVFKLDGLMSPGKTTIAECNGRELTWQEQQAPGMSGAFVTFRGEKLTSVTYKIELWGKAQFTEHEKLVEWATAAKNERPVRGMRLIDLRLAALRIPQVAIARIPHQELVGPGHWFYVWKFQEYKRLQLFGGTPKAPANAREKLIVELEAKRNGLEKEAAAAVAAARARK